MNNYYNKNLKEYANDLRSNSFSRAEKFIWKSLLSRNKLGTKFKRQRPIDNFIVDFFSQELGLIIEVDGNSHWTKPEYDRFRQDKLEGLGYTFLRFNEGVVLNQLDFVEQQVVHAVHCLKMKNIVNPPP